MSEILTAELPEIASGNPAGPAFITRLMRHKQARFGGTVVLVILVCAFAAPMLVPYNPLEVHASIRLQSPGLAHWFGTDELGRDLLSRVLFGTRYFVEISVVCAAIGGGFGVLLGLIAGSGSAVGDLLIMRLMDILLAFPFILLILAIIAILGPSLWTAMIAVGAAWIPNYARLVRGEVFAVKHEEYVEAMRSLGAGELRIMFGTVLPNILPQVVVYASYAMPLAVLAASALSFLGLGAQPPLPEWGAMVVGGRVFIRSAWWVAAAPGAAIFLAVLSCNLLGNALRDVLGMSDVIDPTGPILSIEDLRTQFATHEGIARAVDGLDLVIRPGEILGLVGESGCGKTATALSVMRLIESPGRIAGGRIVFAGRDLLRLNKAQMAAIRGEEIAMIFQQPRTSLNPVIRIGKQIAEQLVRRRGVSHRGATEEAVRLLTSIGIPAAAEKLNAYPHELSGGQAQRAMIAIALALRPRLLIADEPTTAVDVTVQAQVMRVLRDRCTALNAALILVTHDLGLVAQVADRVAVMYAGQIVEQADVTTLFEHPTHPYTRGLLRSLPRLGKVVPRLVEIPGSVPNLIQSEPGCRFATRCAERVAHRLDRCTQEAPPAIGNDHLTRCWLAA
ncbi:MAG: dipeptide/oligopeptide/nickel ABC transporter permease/ATP-binding protein [Acetobacteraceae bacterium]